ncbi:Ltp family lipoprotein [Anaerovorax odorimutans]|uniref:Ltp family lipoprotein n=1 Tax=Anaerovorax odorimutans TaxID=109327 RepID=UPI001A99573C|nr:Ltp family lipoprotein [Anaerovorax odorimutans]
MTVLFSLTVTGFASTGSKALTATFNNIKIYVDQNLVTPKDSNGNTVEPFISGGTTYLPVRAVADALGKEVSWDSATKSVYIGTQPTTPNQGTQTSVTLGEKNALAKAKSYLESMSFSYSGLIKQLEYEGFSSIEATYGADNCNANWDEQAAKKAKTYMESMSFSRDSLIQQLKYEGFTDSQAEYGAKAVGY